MELDFWKIAMRPGKPLMVGSLGRTHVLGLPGNPVSSLVCSLLFLEPLVAKLAPGATRRTCATRHSPPAANDQRQDYVRAKAVVSDDGKLVATPFPVQDSSMLRTLAEANALIVRAPFAPAAEKGDACRVLMLR